MQDSAVAVVEDAVLRAAAQVIAQHGWHEFTLERVADAAGLSRVTLYRRGITRDLLVDALTVGAAQAWQAALWPALMHEGNGAARLRVALAACCEVVEAHLDLLAGLSSAPDPVFHLDAPGGGHDARDVYVGPFARLLRDGAVDGSLEPQADYATTATLLFNVVPRTYLHLRAAHGWDADTTRTALEELLMNGLVPHPTHRTRPDDHGSGAQ